MMLVYPQINLNGTDAQTLRAEYLEAMIKVEDAIAAVKNITLHNRDYHMLGTTALALAQRFRQVRLDTMEAIKLELVAFVLEIDRQLEGRAQAIRH